jgi:hypothetical protein
LKGKQQQVLTITITSTNQATFEVRVKSVDQDAFYLVINDLKQRVPAYLRTYNATRRVWMIQRDAAHYLREWVSQAQDAFSATVEGDPGPWTKYRKPNWQSSYDAPPPRGPRAVPSEAEAFAALCLTPAAPGPLIKAAYRELAKLNHPDHGGDTAAMQKVNSAFDVLKGRLAA